MARPSNRAGFGIQRGGLNPPIFVGGSTAPSNPTDKMIWIDKVNSQISVYEESSSSWIVLGV